MVEERICSLFAVLTVDIVDSEELVEIELATVILVVLLKDGLSILSIIICRFFSDLGTVKLLEFLK